MIFPRVKFEDHDPYRSACMSNLGNQSCVYVIVIGVITVFNDSCIISMSIECQRQGSWDKTAARDTLSLSFPNFPPIALVLN